MMESTTIDFTAYDASSAMTPSKECNKEYSPYQSPASGLLSSASSFTESPASSLGGASSPERYTPTKPGIRIRKRVPTSSIYSTKGTKYEKLEKILEKGSRRELKSTAELLLLTPGKSILRRDQISMNGSRRSVDFSDEIGLPLVEIQEIPSVKNGQPASDCENDVLEEYKSNDVQINDPNETPFRLIKCYRPEAKFCAEESQSAIVERKRIRDLGILTGPVFGVIELQDDPALAEEADKSVKSHIPSTIPVSSVSVARGSLIRDLPLPGRKQSPPITQEQVQQYPAYTPSPVYETKEQTTSQVTVQYAQLTEPPVTEYYATTSFENTAKTEDTSVKNIVSSLSVDTKKLLSLLTAKKTPVAVPQMPDVQVEQDYSSQIEQASTSDEPTGYHYVGSFATKQPTHSQDNHYSQLPQSSQALSANVTHSILSTIQHQQELLAKPLPGIIGSQYVQGAWKINKPCTYFVYKNDGCQRGDSCRYLHDQSLKDELLRSKNNQNKRQMSPPLAHQMRSDSMGQRVERVGSRGQRVSRFDPVGAQPSRDRRVFDQGNNDRRVYDQGNNDRRRNERSRFNRRSRFDCSPNSRSPQN